MRGRSLPAYRVGTAQGAWSGRKLTAWEWAFLEFHRLHDEREEAVRTAELHAKIVRTAIDLATGLRTEDIEQSNQIFEVVRTLWFGDLPSEDGELTYATFRNTSRVFSYEARVEQDEAYPGEEELMQFLKDDEESGQ